VKTTHHRARKAMEAYDRARCIPTPERREKARVALQAFVAGLVQQDVAAIERLLASSVRALNDGAGEFSAARLPILGAPKVALAYVKLSRRTEPVAFAQVQMLNGLPAMVIEYVSAPDGVARRFVLGLDVDAEGKITELFSVLATRKLTKVRFAAA
jgi:RNA polymerase sigma-70 factor (ECF subfamily)